MPTQGEEVGCQHSPRLRKIDIHARNFISKGLDQMQNIQMRNRPFALDVGR